MPITINTFFGSDLPVINQFTVAIVLLAILIARSIYWRKSEKRFIEKQRKIADELNRKRFENGVKPQLWRHNADND